MVQFLLSCNSIDGLGHIQPCTEEVSGECVSPNIGLAGWKCWKSILEAVNHHEEITKFPTLRHHELMQRAPPMLELQLEGEAWSVHLWLQQQLLRPVVCTCVARLTSIF